MNTRSRILMLFLLAVFTVGGIVSAANAAGLPMNMTTGDAMSGVMPLEKGAMESMAECDGCSISDDGTLLSCSGVGSGLCGGVCVISLSAIVQSNAVPNSLQRQHHVDSPTRALYNRTVSPELHPPRRLS